MKTLEVSIENCSDIVKKNLRTWVDVWERECEHIDHFEEGDYSRHLLLIITDLIEEIDSNYDSFSKNRFAKNYFYKILNEYYGYRQKNSNSLSQKKEQLLDKQQAALVFIQEALKNDTDISKFNVNHISTLLKRLESELKSSEIFQVSIELLKTILTQEQELSFNDVDLIFITDTILLLYWHNGLILDQVKSLPNGILELFNDTHRIDDSYSTYYPSTPIKGDLNIEEYRVVLETFYYNLTLDQRFDELTKIFLRKQKSYEVIFQITGIDLHETEGFSIGNVRVYNPEIEKHIVKPYREGDVADLFGIESTDKKGICIAVTIEGIDPISIRMQARKSAERALDFLLKIEKRNEPIKLSLNYAVVEADSKRTVASGRSAIKQGEFIPKAWVNITEDSRMKFGEWITKSDIHITIEKWLQSIDWHRRSIESQSSSDELLNAWFSVEHLFDEDYKIPIRLPEYFNKVLKNNLVNSWMNNNKLRIIQIVLGIVSLKSKISNYVGKISGYYVDQDINRFNRINIPVEILRLFCDEEKKSWSPLKFVECSQTFRDHINSEISDSELFHMDNMIRIFFDSKYSIQTVAEEIEKVKNDVYNIYRLRNMLVHTASTKSKLIDYYAHRIREYSYFILNDLQWKLLKCENDNSIPSLENYFNEVVIEANIIFESMINGKMESFKKWVFSY